MPICIAGMHRSGTSMVARLLHLCGLYLGSATDFRAAGPDNPEGFWENVHFVNLNDDVLGSLEAAWDVPPVNRPGWELGAAQTPLRDKAERLLQQFRDHEPWGWKDPRNCFTLPFWRALIPGLTVLICVRNPLEVAASLRERNFSSERFGLDLWLSYNRRLLATVPSEHRVVTHYESYFRDPVAELRRVADLLNLDASDEAILHACSVVAPRLRHAQFTVPQLIDRNVSLPVRATYVSLCFEAGPVYQPIMRDELGECAPSPRDEIDDDRHRDPHVEGGGVGADLAPEDAAAKWRSACESGDSAGEITAFSELIRSLATRLGERDDRVHALEAELAKREQGLQAAMETVAERDRLIGAMEATRLWRFGRWYWRLRDRVKAAAPAAWTRARARTGATLRADRSISRPRRTLPGVRPTDHTGFPPDMTLGQPLSQDTLHAALASAVPVRSSKYDVVCFSIIDWHFRFQRPQQLMTQAARAGHRVFYVTLQSSPSPGGNEALTSRFIADNILDIRLPVSRAWNIYASLLDPDDATLMAALDELRASYHIETAICCVQIPSWTAVALRARQVWGWRVVYDCMDEWQGFPLISRAVTDAERALVQDADVVVVTSERLRQKWANGRTPVLARNGVDFDVYTAACRPNHLLEQVPHPIIGYFGAIAKWVDVGLIEYAARQRPDWHFVLLGGIFDVDVSGLRARRNVRLLGQQPYEHMPAYLYHFDACIIPFVVNEITAAVDPVKLYEYLSAGKPVVATKLPELEAWSDIVSVARDPEEFVAYLEQALQEHDAARVRRRVDVARQNTWAERWGRIDAAAGATFKRVSIVIVTFNRLAHTKLCLHSVIANTEYPSYEIIVVDNASTDGTDAYLRELERARPGIRIVLNASNRGFAAANNQGLALAGGDVLVLLNNDTIVPRNWLTRLVSHLDDPEAGLIGPATNFAGNEARLETTYRTYEEFRTFAQAQTHENEGKRFDIRMLAMFCLAMRRDVYERIGALDERFEIGMFEDDDYALRAQRAGYRVMCAEDVFVHHFGQATFGDLLATGEYQRVFDANRHRFEEKWGVRWEPHRWRRP